MLKDILAVVEEADAAADFLQKIGGLAKAQDAYLEVAALTPAPMISSALAPFGSLYVPPSVLQDSDNANIEKVRAILEQTGCRYEVLGFHNDVAWLAGDFRRSGQIADIVIVGTEECWPTPWLRTRVLENLVGSAGTPILILPAGKPFPTIRRAVLGWKPSPEAKRAVHGLVRLAEPGASVEVVTVGITLAECEKEADSQAEVKRHLARHGLEAEGRWLPIGDQIEAEALTRHALEMDADILVVGGFARSRIREIILGGVTRDLVYRADLPVLIAG